MTKVNLQSEDIDRDLSEKGMRHIRSTLHEFIPGHVEVRCSDALQPYDHSLGTDDYDEDQIKKMQEL